MAVWSKHGLKFQYPDGWELEESRTANEYVVTVSSPNTAFWSLTLLFDSPGPRQVIESVLDVFRGNYDDVDIYESSDRLCETPGLSWDLEFICLDLTNSAFLRSIETPGCTVLVLYQATDHELAHTRPALQAISASLTCEELTGEELV